MAVILKIACPDRVGLLSRITTFVAQHGGNLLDVSQFTDPVHEWFFARLAIDPTTLHESIESLRAKFAPIGEELGAEWKIRDDATPTRVIVLVSKAGHCLADLLWRWRSGELPIEIPLVISNHPDFRETVEREGIEFRCIPVEENNRDAAFAEIARLFVEHRAEAIVLARYMQILPPEMCAQFAGRIINIHHSFLPSFVGQDPYRRAYERGVKLVGATCHYVTGELDDGPIIEQEVVRVEHFHTPEDLLRLGRDCERLALARGVRYHIHDRVLIHGKKSVVFRD